MLVPLPHPVGLGVEVLAVDDPPLRDEFDEERFATRFLRGVHDDQRVPVAVDTEVAGDRKSM